MSGCPFECEGCIVKNLQNPKTGKKYKDFYTNIKSYLSKIDGITFSGGEPLYQSKELFLLLNKLPKKLDKMLYTGYTKEELKKEQLKCYNLFDLVVEGRFEIDKIGDFLWRGSSNQIFSSPTKKYKSSIKELYSKKSAGLEIKVDKNEIAFYGIPTNRNEIKQIDQQLSNHLLIKHL